MVLVLYSILLELNCPCLNFSLKWLTPLECILFFFRENTNSLFTVWCHYNVIRFLQNHHNRHLNSLALGKFEWNFRYLIFKIISVIDGWGISCELGHKWMSLDLTDDKSSLVQVMAWCHQATSHYLSQCWPRSLSPYGVTRPQWVKALMYVLPQSLQLWIWYMYHFIFYHVMMAPDCLVVIDICYESQSLY